MIYYFYEVDENKSQNVFYDITKSAIKKMKENKNEEKCLLYDEGKILKELHVKVIDTPFGFINFILDKYP